MFDLQFQLKCNNFELPPSLTFYGPNSFFRCFFLGHPKIGSFRLPTHRRDAHNFFFFDDPFLF